MDQYCRFMIGHCLGCMDQYCRSMIGHRLGLMESSIKKCTPHCILFSPRQTIQRVQIQRVTLLYDIALQCTPNNSKSPGGQTTLKPQLHHLVLMIRRFALRSRLKQSSLDFCQTKSAPWLARRLPSRVWMVGQAAALYLCGAATLAAWPTILLALLPPLRPGCYIK